MDTPGISKELKALKEYAGNLPSCDLRRTGVTCDGWGTTVPGSAQADYSDSCAGFKCCHCWGRAWTHDHHKSPGIYEIPATEYHADPCPEPSLSASVARTLIDRSPLHAWMQHPKLGGQQEEKPAARMSLGSAAHSVILQGNWDLYRVHRCRQLPHESGKRRAGPDH